MCPSSQGIGLKYFAYYAIVIRHKTIKFDWQWYQFAIYFRDFKVQTDLTQEIRFIKSMSISHF